MPKTNTLAYHKHYQITAVKCFILVASGGYEQYFLQTPNERI